MSDSTHIKEILILRRQLAVVKSKVEEIKENKKKVEQELGVIPNDSLIEDILNKYPGKRIFSELIERKIGKVGKMNLRDALIYLLESEAKVKKPNILDKTVNEIILLYPESKRMFLQTGISYNDEKVSESVLYLENSNKEDLIHLILNGINYNFVCKTQEAKMQYNNIDMTYQMIRSFNSRIKEMELKIPELEEKIRDKKDSKEIKDDIERIKLQLSLKNLRI